MFTFSTNHPMKVFRSGSFARKDGSEGAFIICRECDNQPPEIERPSKSRKPIKFWLDKLPEGVCDDGYIIFTDILGGEWKDIPATDINGNKMKDRYGNDIYNSELVLVVEGLKAFEMPAGKDQVKRPKM